jgi:hypothetical protein
MFKTDLDESIFQSYMNSFEEKFFPLSLVTKKDSLIITDQRYESLVYIFLYFLVFTFPIFLLVTIVSYSFFWGLILLIFTVLFIVALIFLMRSFCQQMVFYKDYNYYELNNRNFVSSNSKRIRIDHLKEVLLETKWYKNEETSEKTFHSSVQLVFMASENQVILNGSSREFGKIAEIAYAISDFLKIPCVENEIDF